MQEPCMRNDSFLERNSGGSQALRYAMNTAVDESDTSREESHSPKTVLLQPLDEHVGRKKANQIPFGIKNLSRSSSENSTFEYVPKLFFFYFSVWFQLDLESINLLRLFSFSFRACMQNPSLRTLPLGTTLSSSRI